MGLCVCVCVAGGYPGGPGKVLLPVELLVGLGGLFGSLTDVLS